MAPKRPSGSNHLAKSTNAICWTLESPWVPSGSPATLTAGRRANESVESLQALRGLSTLGMTAATHNQSAGQPSGSGSPWAGATTLRQIAEALNARGIPTARGGQWHAKSVSSILERA
jgi:hypothetical protein